MPNLISDQQWSHYREHGYVNLGKIVSDDRLAALTQRIDDIMLGKADADYDRMLMQLDTDAGAYSDLPPQTKGFKKVTLGYRKIEDLEWDPIFLDYIQIPIFREACRRVYGSNTDTACYRAMFFNKPPAKGTVLPWHQDGGASWFVDRDPLLTVWTALDPATIANGCVQIVPGSHETGLIADHTLTPEQEKQLCPEDKIVYLELEPGNVVLLHNWLIHRSDINRTQSPRRAFSVCYIDARSKSFEESRPFPVVFGRGALDPGNLPKGKAIVDSTC